MTDYMTEQEQIEQLKLWMKEYGMTILAGIVLAIVLVSAWRYWDRYTTKQTLQASAIYDEMLMDRAQNDKDNLAKSVTQAENLMKNYPKTPYAQMAGLMLARDAVANKKYDNAIGNLEWVISHSNNDALKQIAHLRLARIYTAQNKPEETIHVLNKVNDPIFKAMRDEVMGDAYAHMKKLPEAQKYYQLALEEFPQQDITQRPILEMKLDDLNNAMKA